jgi:hypothetical protein
MRKGEPIAGRLIDIAGTLNARLPATTRVKPDDLRLRKPIDDTLDLERYATVLGAIAVW